MVRKPGETGQGCVCVLHQFFRNSCVYAVEVSNWENYWQRLKSPVCMLNKHSTTAAWLCLKVQASVSFFLAFLLQVSEFRMEEWIPPGLELQRFVYISCLVGNVADFSLVSLISDWLPSKKLSWLLLKAFFLFSSFFFFFNKESDVWHFKYIRS